LTAILRVPGPLGFFFPPLLLLWATMLAAWVVAHLRKD
jgi:hypothetical protein